MPGAAPSERERVDAARSGDRTAFEGLYRDHVGFVFALCLRLVADRGEAEILTQDVFVRAWKKLGTYRGDGPFGGWLRRLAVNVVIEEKRSEARRGRFAAGTHDGEAPARASGPMDERSRFGTAGRYDAAIDLERAIAGLPEGARRVFVLHDVEGYRHDEIAEMIGRSPGTVRSQVHRARALLRERLGEGEIVNHEEARNLLNDWVDGVLPEDRRRDLEGHLRACSACAREGEEVRALLRRTRSLPRSIEPGRDLWTGIESRLGGPESGTVAAARGVRAPLRRWSRALVPSIAAAAVLLAALLFRGGAGEGEGEEEQWFASPVRTVQAGIAFAGVAKQCLETQRDLFRLARADGSVERGDVLAEYSIDLERIETALAEAERAWAENPDDPFLTKHLARIYETKARLQARGARKAVEV